MQSSLAFWAGDELGRISALNVSLDNPKEPQIVAQPAYAPDAPDKLQAVRILKLSQDASEPLLACARIDASAALYSVNEDAPLKLLSRWKLARHGPGYNWVSLDFVPGRGILTCATSGRIVLNSHEGEILSNVSAHLPANLKDLRLSGDAKSFAIGGNEVDLCTWDLEQTLSSDGIEPLTANSTKKRKGKKNDLLPGETWRAQNVPNDNLDLRVPVHITSLCYLDRTKSTELMTGTSFGAVRRYDTRASRRPVADFSDVVKKSSIDRVQRGVSEHDVFVSDSRGQLFALDVRNGRQLYAYKGVGGTVTSMALGSKKHLLSASMDRFVRLHSTFMPPATAGQNMDGRGEIVAKLYTQDVVTAVVPTSGYTSRVADAADDVGEEIWDQLPDADDEEDAQTRRKRRKA